VIIDYLHRNSLADISHNMVNCCVFFSDFRYSTLVIWTVWCIGCEKFGLFLSNCSNLLLNETSVMCIVVYSDNEV